MRESRSCGGASLKNKCRRSGAARKSMRGAARMTEWKLSIGRGGDFVPAEPGECRIGGDVCFCSREILLGEKGGVLSFDVKC